MKKPNLPIEPPEDLIRSMMIRYDHALAFPGYYDQPIFAGGPTHKQREESAYRIMKQLYEEVSGNGFYQWKSK